MHGETIKIVYTDVCVVTTGIAFTSLLVWCHGHRQFQMCVCDVTICNGSHLMYTAWKRNNTINMFLQYMWHPSNLV
jgi:hypothetical protein